MTHDIILAAVLIAALIVCTAGGIVAGFAAGVAVDAAVGFRRPHSRLSATEGQRDHA